MLTKEDLIGFEDEVVEHWKNKEIRSPVHLSGGNEEQLIGIFKDVKPEDWIFSTHRSHYHILLKGVPRDWLINEVLKNKSIHLMSKKYKIVTSAIVGGSLSIALGAAMALKMKKSKNHVWAFCGDMTAEHGTFLDCVKYARRNDLPITFIVEDNGLSTDTPTQEAWGLQEGGPNVLRYTYKRKWPHYGCGVFVDFEDD